MAYDSRTGTLKSFLNLLEEGESKNEKKWMTRRADGVEDEMGN